MSDPRSERTTPSPHIAQRPNGKPTTALRVDRWMPEDIMTYGGAR